MDKYLMFMEKVLILKEDIENKIAEGKRKGYIFKTYKLGTNEFEVIDGLIIEAKIINNRFGIWVTTYHLDGDKEIQNLNLLFYFLLIRWLSINKYFQHLHYQNNK